MIQFPPTAHPTLSTGHRRAPTLHWLQSPSVLRLGSRDRSTRLYTSGQTDKFMHLQRRIDQEFQNQLNDVDAGTVCIHLDLVSRLRGY